MYRMLILAVATIGINWAAGGRPKRSADTEWHIRRTSPRNSFSNLECRGCSLLGDGTSDA
jgi:hypothetical protein